MDRFGSVKTFVISNVICFPFLLFLPFLNSLFLVSLFLVLFYFFGGVAWLSFSTFLAVSAPEERRALFLGSAWSMWRFGYAFGSIFCGTVWGTLGIGSLFPISATLFLSSTLLIFPKHDREK